MGIRTTIAGERSRKLSLPVLLHDDFMRGPLFSISDLEDEGADMSISEGLDEGKVWENLSQEFRKRGFQVSTDADVLIHKPGSRWQINEGNEVYLIRLTRVLTERGELKPHRLYISTPGGRPIGRMEVSLKERKLEASQNLSGYYVFTDVEDGNYTVQVTSDQYFPEKRQVKLPITDPGSFVEHIILKPIPSYPFPPGATLIKGVVRDSVRRPIEGAVVEVLEKGIRSRTTQKGEFVLYFKGVTQEDVDEKGFIKGDNGLTTLTLEVDGDQSNQLETEVQEGKTRSVLIVI